MARKSIDKLVEREEQETIEMIREMFALFGNALVQTIVAAGISVEGRGEADLLTKVVDIHWKKLADKVIEFAKED